MLRYKKNLFLNNQLHSERGVAARRLVTLFFGSMFLSILFLGVVRKMGNSNGEAGFEIGNKLEFTKPEILTMEFPVSVGPSLEKLLFSVSDAGSGIGIIIVEFVDDTGNEVIYQKDFSSVLKHEVDVSIDIADRLEGNKSRSVSLIIKASDRSFMKNTTIFTERLPVDSEIPSLSILSKSIDIKKGSSALFFYRVKDRELSHSGVALSGKSFKGYPARFFDREFFEIGSDIYMSLFPVPSELTSLSDFSLTAVDMANNRSVRH